jgi:hypothetical protein
VLPHPSQPVEQQPNGRPRKLFIFQ